MGTKMSSVRRSATDPRNAIVTVTVTNDQAVSYTVKVDNAGSGYQSGNTIVILGSLLGGVDSTSFAFRIWPKTGNAYQSRRRRVGAPWCGQS